MPKFTAVEWLVLLRALPFEDFAPSVGGSVDGFRSRAEILSASSRRSLGGAGVSAGVSAFSGADFAQAIRFVARVGFIELAQHAYLGGLFGGTVTHAPGRPPSVTFEASTEAAVQLFTRRLREDRTQEVATTGTELLRADMSWQDASSLLVLGWTREWMIDERTDLMIRYIPYSASLEAYIDFASNHPEFVNEDVVDRQRLQMGALLGLQIKRVANIERRETFDQLFQFGLYQASDFAFEDSLARSVERYRDQLQILVPEERLTLKRAAETLTDTSWIANRRAHRPPLARRAIGTAVIDLAASTDAITQGATVGRIGGSALALLRGDHFELVVQSLIDQSAFAPPPNIRGLRGRDLRNGNRIVTDVDAFAVDGDVLLLIDAKSFPRLREYELGDYGLLDSRRRHIVKAVAKWETRLADFRLHPQGRNYDFRAYSTILGMVCISGPFYLPIGEATREVYKGLRSACTYSELAAFLDIDVGYAALLQRIANERPS